MRIDLKVKKKMNATIGIYGSHEEAIEAVEFLKQKGFPVQQLSLIGKAVIIDELLHVKNRLWMKVTPAIIGAFIGPVLGILTGIEVIAFPGMTFLYGAGALVGAMGGFSIGMVSGGIITLIAVMVFKTRNVLKYHERVEKKGFQIIVHGTRAQIYQAKALLESKP